MSDAEGTMKTREGRVVSGDNDHLEEQIFRPLLREGWLDHSRDGSRSS